MGEHSAENDAPEHWHEGGDGHGYGYQYIGPIHYMCECGQHFLDREGWRRHRATLGLATDSPPRCACVTPPAKPAPDQRPEAGQ